MFDVLPKARREMAESEVRHSRGAENGVADTGFDEGLKRSCV